MRLPWVETGPRFPSMLAAERKIDHKEFHKTLNNLEKGDRAFEKNLFFFRVPSESEAAPKRLGQGK